MLEYKAAPGEPLPPGHRYERNATRIVFDISDILSGAFTETGALQS